MAATIVSPETCVPVGLLGMATPLRSGSGAELESRNHESRFDDGADAGGGFGGGGEVVAAGGAGDSGFIRTRSVLAPVQASRRAVKQASPSFQWLSSRTAFRRFALRSSSLASTEVATVSGLLNRYAENEVVFFVVGASSSERSDSHSARGRKWSKSSDTEL